MKINTPIQTTILVFVLFWTCSITAQNQYQFEEAYQKVKVYNINNKLMKNGFAGGMNQPQFSHLDLNNDGQKDLVIYDRTCHCFSTFLGTDTSWVFAPQYIADLPQVKEGFALFRDYNGDGLLDLFFKSTFSIGVYKNVSSFGEKIKLKLVDDNIQSYNFYPPPLDSNGIEVGKLNIPDISDLDADGDIDILALNTFGQGIQYFLNNTKENQLGLEKLSYELPDDCWGNFEEGSSTNTINLQRGMFCPGSAYRYKKHVGGSSLLTFDYDSDGDNDLLLGNAGFGNLIYLENGKADFSLKYDSMIAYDTLFPFLDDRAEMETFPAAYLIDVDHNNTMDLVVTVNLSDKSSGIFHEKNQVICFPNLLENGFSFEKSIPFLTDEILDFGAYSKPSLVDIDGDGDLDMVVANNGDYGLTKDSSDRLTLLVNSSVGDTTYFKVVDQDFAALSKHGIQKMSVTFGDIDNDGDPDMLMGRKQGDLWFFENIGDSFSAQFELRDTHWKNIEIGWASTPAFYDFNQDNRLDLFVGEYGGNINYFENSGTLEVPNFEWLNDSMFDVYVNEFRTDVNPPGYASEGYSSPTLFRIKDSTYFLSGSASGNLFSDTGQIYFSSDSNPVKLDFGWNSHPALGDINNDGCLDLVLGHARGGINLLMGKCKDDTIGIQKIKKSSIKLYPNPSNGEVKIEGLPKNGHTTTYCIFSMNGQKVTEIKTLFDQKINENHLENGIYLLKILTDGKSYVKKLVINQH